MGCGSGNDETLFRRLLPIALRILIRHRCVSLRGIPEKRIKGEISLAAATAQQYTDT